MKIVNLEQGTEDWRQFRRSRITATDFAIYAAHLGLCYNMYRKSLATTIRDKLLCKEIKDNKYFQLGRDKEQLIIDSGNYIDVKRGEIITLDENDRIMASLDARDEILEVVIECKASTKDVFEFKNQLEYYQYQILHQCYTCGYNIGHLRIGYYKELNGKWVDNHGILDAEIYASQIMSKDEWMHHCINFLNILDSGEIK